MAYGVAARTPTLSVARRAFPQVGTIVRMTVSTTTGQPTETRRIRVLLFSDDRTTRDAVRFAVGNQPAPDVQVEEWHEVATSTMVEMAVKDEQNHYDVLVLDGEAQPYGGLGLCRQLKNEVFDCPPVLVLIGRREDGWLAAWSQADAVVTHPLDHAAVAEAVARLARS